MVTLELLRSAKNAYPVRVLEDGGTALIVFAAAFQGAQDAVWIEQAGMAGTCVDRNHERLGSMAMLYPQGWEYVHGDAYEYALATERTWDVVSLDPFTNEFQRCADYIDLWCHLANRAVVIGTGVGTEIDPPAGWQITERLIRSQKQGGIFWAVLERC